MQYMMKQSIYCFMQISLFLIATVCLSGNMEAIQTPESFQSAIVDDSLAMADQDNILAMDLTSPLLREDLLEVLIAEEAAILKAENGNPEFKKNTQKIEGVQDPQASEHSSTEAEKKKQSEKELEKIFQEEYGIGKDLTPYRLRIGDKLFISIYGEANTGRMVMVDQTGSIQYLIVDQLFVLGKTIEELRHELNQEVSKHFKHTFIAITPIDFGSQYYTILGEVKTPGKKIIHGKPTLLAAIAEAGGLREGVYRTQTVELADLSHAFLARDGDYLRVDFKKLIVDGDIRENVELLSGDYIYIPNSLYKEIHVLGEVKSPTTFGFINTVSLVEAIAQARGLTHRASSRICVIRGSLSQPKKFLIDINLILRGLEPNFLLQPGDIVYAPPRKFQNLREIFELAVSAFIGEISTVAGENEFIRMTPAAKGTPIINTQPVNIYNITPIMSVDPVDPLNLM